MAFTDVAAHAPSELLPAPIGAGVFPLQGQLEPMQLASSLNAQCQRQSWSSPQARTQRWNLSHPKKLLLLEEAVAMAAMVAWALWRMAHRPSVRWATSQSAKEASTPRRRLASANHKRGEPWLALATRKVDAGVNALRVYTKMLIDWGDFVTSTTLYIDGVQQLL